MKKDKTRQRKPRWYVVAGVLFCIIWASGSLYVGITESPIILQWFAERSGIKPIPQIETGSWNEFPLLYPYGNSTFVNDFVKVNYTVYGNDISVGQPVWLSVNATVQGPANLSAIFVEPQNTFESPYGGSVSVNLNPSKDSVRQQIWSGSTLVEFNTAGPLIVIFSAVTSWQPVGHPEKWSTSTFTERNVIQDIIIGPSGSGQTAFYEKQNLSLTMFILFFAAFDIAVALSEHVYKDVKKAKDSANDKLNETNGRYYCPE